MIVSFAVVDAVVIITGAVVIQETHLL